MRCQWCGTFVGDATPGWDGKTFVCSQGCHEFSKMATGKSVGMGAGLPHTYVPPAEPERWPGWEEKRASFAARARNAGIKSAERSRNF
jgi:hypothetical protein